MGLGGLLCTDREEKPTGLDCISWEGTWCNGSQVDKTSLPSPLVRWD